jgi:hypothetical protein
MEHTQNQEENDMPLYSRSGLEKSLSTGNFSAPSTYEALDQFLLNLQGNPELRKRWDAAVLRKPSNGNSMNQLLTMLREHVAQREQWEESAQPINLGDKYTLNTLLHFLGLAEDDLTTPVDSETKATRMEMRRAVGKKMEPGHRLAA